MQVAIQYCVVWNYEPRAAGLAAEIEEAFPGSTVRLVEASGGLFEVTVEGELVFSKRALDRHAKSGEVLALIRKRQQH